MLFGGRSAEHDVSRVSAAHVLAAADPERYEVVPIGITRDGQWVAAEGASKALAAGAGELPARLDVEGPELDAESALEHSAGEQIVVFPLLHGPLGEDGTVQGLLELLDAPYVGSGVLGSSVSMDKAMAKVVLGAAGVPQTRWVSLRADQRSTARTDALVDQLGLPLFVKPANMGSSVGVSKARDRRQLDDALDVAFSYDEWVVVEEAVTAREIEVAVLGDLAPRASIPGEIVPSHEFYDYEDKYLDDGAGLLIPAPLSPEDVATVQTMAVEAFQALRCEGMARIDFFFEEGGRGFLCNEANTIPGFTPISMYPKLWQASGVSYAELVDELVQLALARHARRRRNTAR